MNGDVENALRATQEKALAEAGYEEQSESEREEALLVAAMIEGLFVVDRIASAAERIADALERTDR